MLGSLGLIVTLCTTEQASTPGDSMRMCPLDDAELVREVLRLGLIDDQICEYASRLVRRSEWRRGIAKGATIGVAVGAAAPVALAAAGFTAAGVAAGSIAAGIQTPLTAAGGWFALAQSVGATGAAVVPSIASGVGLGAAAVGGAVTKETATDDEIFETVLARSLMGDRLRELLRRKLCGAPRL